MPYRSLNADKIIETLAKLAQRIEERFPGRGLSKVCGEMLEIAQTDARRAGQIHKPYYALRLGVAAILLAGIWGIWWAGSQWLKPGVDAVPITGLESIEALINIVILTAAGVWFLMNLETRLKRARVLSDLHELRSLSHVIDMHQLTKDPLVVLGRGPATASSPERDMSAFELGRYLDYCSEMLSVIAKLAALYADRSRDEVVNRGVDDIQDLTTSLSGKIWQKIMLLEPETRADGKRRDDDLDTVNRNASPLHPFALGED